MRTSLAAAGLPCQPEQVPAAAQRLGGAPGLASRLIHAGSLASGPRTASHTASSPSSEPPLGTWPGRRMRARPVKRSPSWDTSAIGAPAGWPPISSPLRRGELIEHLAGPRGARSRPARTPRATRRRCISASTRAVAAAVSASSAGPRISDSAYRAPATASAISSRSPGSRGQAVFDRSREWRRSRRAHRDQHEHRERTLGDDESHRARSVSARLESPQQRERAARDSIRQHRPEHPLPHVSATTCCGGYEPAGSRSRPADASFDAPRASLNSDLASSVDRRHRRGRGRRAADQHHSARRRPRICTIHDARMRLRRRSPAFGKCRSRR